MDQRITNWLNISKKLQALEIFELLSQQKQGGVTMKPAVDRKSKALPNAEEDRDILQEGQDDHENGNDSNGLKRTMQTEA
ncbi:hypothetical protein Y1Q_0016667 [Alligator mississippiensis]|uniref:Uncharacterized protein n=1 Tax=Alligator mississippiensis TaxID=8496 RepID=A0A151P1E9_ALLMI|nr:hypothetical protein Y1Q_0016667 [Alligator mississippiensis]